MIKEFVALFEAGKPKLRQQFAAKHPEKYKELVQAVVGLLAETEDEDYDRISADRIHEIDDGNYQGTLLYLIASSAYQPRKYWFVRVSYGSCSGCDTLQNIRSYSDEPPTEENLNDYLTLCLHIVQGLKLLPATDEV